MDLDPKTAEAIAKEYFRTFDPIERLGWGISGFVYLSPDLRTAVKVHRHREGFEREVEAYRVLTRLKIFRLCGLTIPKPRSYVEDPMLIRMDVVSPPFLLDFAGVSFDAPDFEPDTMAQWHQGINEMFGPNAHVVYAVYHALSQHGIYYMDFRPTNLNLTGLPGVVPYTPGEDDDDRY